MQAVKLRRFIKDTDPLSFIVITNTGEIIGKVSGVRCSRYRGLPENVLAKYNQRQHGGNAATTTQAIGCA